MDYFYFTIDEDLEEDAKTASTRAEWNWNWPHSDQTAIEPTEFGDHRDVGAEVSALLLERDG